jgi:hypothetical protein
MKGRNCSGTFKPSIRCHLFIIAVIPDPAVIITSSLEAFT